MKYTAREAAAAMKGAIVSGPDTVEAGGVSTDSRKLKAGEAFVALVGPRFDAHDFLPAALKQGAAFVVAARGRGRGLSGTVIEVDDTLAALGRLAADWRRRFPVKVVGITGSVGKSTTKEMTAEVLGAAGSVLKNTGNLNNLIGLPQTVFQLDDAHDFMVLEMGCNVPGEIDRLGAIAAPEVSVITRVAPVHLEGLKSLAGVAKEKAGVIRKLDPKGVFIQNLDDPEIAQVAKAWKGKTIGFTLNPEAQFSGRVFRLMGMSKEVTVSGRPTIRFWLQDKQPGRNEGPMAEFVLNALSPHNAANTLIAAAVGSVFGVSLKLCAERLLGFVGLPGRGEVEKTGKGAFLINDYYNASPVAVAQALQTMAWWKGPLRGVAVLGEMMELGKDADRYHREAGTNAACLGADALVAVGPRAKLMAEAAAAAGLNKNEIYTAADAAEASAVAKKIIRKGDWVLIKGSRAMGLEAVAKAIR